MIIEDVLEFLQRTPPFQFLDAEALRKLAGSLAVEFYPKGFVILAQDGPPSEFLQIIKKGAVRISIAPAETEESIIDLRSEGDSFGFLSLVSGDRSRVTVTAAADTICYLLDRETTLRLMDIHPGFTQYFLKSFFNTYIEKTYQEMQNKSLLGSGGDKLLFTTPVGSLSRRAVVSAPVSASIQEAAGIMVQNRVSCIILVDDDGQPRGIVTDRDLRKKVVASGKPVTDPVSGIMTDLIHTADSQEFCFEALLTMVRHGIHHLVILEDGKLKGVVSNHDLMMLQGSSPLSFVREIEKQESLEGLFAIAQRTDKIIGILLKEGARASNVTRIITEINDRVQRKVISLIQREMGTPPLDYCWIVYGSDGRREQTFRTDQDNALILADTDDPDVAAVAEQYFTEFSQSVNEALNRCGFPSCPANYMASNPKWRQPLSVWKDLFSKWINHPVPESILLSLIFFDYRPLCGAEYLAASLREHLARMLADQNVFFAIMAATILKNRPPIGFFGNFVVDKSGEHKDKFNIKINGLGPVINVARLLSLEKDVRLTSTIERLAALKEKHSLARDFGEELEHAFEFMTLLRLHHQLEQKDSDQEIDNFIDPNRLGSLEKKSLKEAFRLLAKIQDLVSEEYRAGMVSQ